MVSQTYIKNLKITPKKLRMIRDIIVTLPPQVALEHLLYMTNKAAQVFYKAIQSAISNATHVLKVTPDMLKFKLLTVEEGNKLKRHMAGPKGMANSVIKYFSHIKIVLESTQKVSDKSIKVQDKTTSKKLKIKK